MFEVDSDSRCDQVKSRACNVAKPQTTACLKLFYQRRIQHRNQKSTAKRQFLKCKSLRCYPVIAMPSFSAICSSRLWFWVVMLKKLKQELIIKFVNLRFRWIDFGGRSQEWGIWKIGQTENLGMTQASAVSTAWNAFYLFATGQFRSTSWRRSTVCPWKWKISTSPSFVISSFEGVIKGWITGCRLPRFHVLEKPRVTRSSYYAKNLIYWKTRWTLARLQRGVSYGITFHDWSHFVS